MHPVDTERAGIPSALGEMDLDAEERAILAHADAALARATPQVSFIEGFWGYQPRKTATARCA